MNTPTHVIFAITAFGKRAQPAVTWAAVAGALMPDLSLYLMAGISLFILQIPPNVVFDELYFSAPWQQVFAVDNSFVLWGAGMAIALWRRSPIWIAFCGGALLHLALDFPLHHDDARMHFWPLSRWVFESPISYWDSNHHGQIISVIEALACLICAIILWRRHQNPWARTGIVTLTALQSIPLFMILFRVFT